MASRPPLLDLLDIMPSDGVETSPFVPQDVVFTSAGAPSLHGEAADRGGQR